jgi:hypothetical protein
MKLEWEQVGENYVSKPYTIIPNKRHGWDAYLADYKKPTGYCLTKSDRVYTLKECKQICQETEDEAVSTA